MTSEFLQRVKGFKTSLAIKAPCAVQTTANITLSGEQTINSVAVVAGDRVLVKDQTTQTENGIYTVSATAWARSEDFNGNSEVVQGTRVPIYNSGTYEVTTAGTATIGTDNITFQKQAIDANLDDIIGVTIEENTFLVGDGGGDLVALTYQQVMEALGHNLSATTDPTVDDDTNLNYYPGSIWVNETTDNVFICADATDGAAVWNKYLNESQVNTVALQKVLVFG